jgi:hypothetical protein
MLLLLIVVAAAAAARSLFIVKCKIHSHTQRTLGTHQPFFQRQQQQRRIFSSAPNNNKLPPPLSLPKGKENFGKAAACRLLFTRIIFAHGLLLLPMVMN